MLLKVDAEADHWQLNREQNFDTVPVAVAYNCLKVAEKFTVMPVCESQSGPQSLADNFYASFYFIRTKLKTLTNF